MTHRIKKQILKVRDSGLTNMLDTNGVMYYANQLNLFDLVVYLDDRDNRKEYWNFIMTGEAEFTDEEEENDEDYGVDDPADDTDEDDLPFLDGEDYGPPAKEEQKEEAIKYMELMHLDTEVIRLFKEDGVIFTCRAGDGVPEPTDEKTLELIRLLEAENGFLVYLSVASECAFGVMDSFLIVSKYREDWQMEKVDIQDGYVMTYTVNHTYPECSEMGSIGFERTKTGGIIRNL